MGLKIKKYRRWKRIDRWLQTAMIAMSIIIVGTLVTAQTISVLTLGRLQIGNNVTVTAGQLLIPDGLATTPGFGFAQETDLGFARLFANQISVTRINVERFRFSVNGGASTETWYSQGSGTWILGVNGTPGIALINGGSVGIGNANPPDTILNRDAPNTLIQKNANFDQIRRLYGANNSYFQVATQSELLTILAAATTNTAMSIPANAVVRGVAVYVVTAIPAPAVTFTVTGTASATVFNTAAVGVAAGSNDVGTQNTPYKNGAAQTIRITPSAIPGAATGQVRIVLMYEIPSPPTS